MTAEKLTFETICTTVTIDYSKCEPAINSTSNPKCGFACVKADRLYDRNILKIEGNRPVLAVSPEEAKKRSNESLSWEYADRVTGNHAIEIKVKFPGLEEYRKKMNLV
jgi:hypothetical protein